MTYESAKRQTQVIKDTCHTLTMTTESIEVQTIAAVLSDMNALLDSNTRSFIEYGDRLIQVESLLKDLDVRIRQLEAKH